jgi:hypothetical protein
MMACIKFISIPAEIFARKYCNSPQLPGRIAAGTSGAWQSETPAPKHRGDAVSVNSLRESSHVQIDPV